MIDKTRKSDRSGIKYSRKDYWLVVVGNKPEGVCTKIETAWACAAYFANKHGAKKVCDAEALYFYEDESGVHYITVQKFKRISFGSIRDDDE